MPTAGRAQDYQEALKWYRLAAEQGDASAQFNLGFMYADGRGVLKDYQEALKWYRLAAEQGYARAQFNLGFMYADGRGRAQGLPGGLEVVPSGGGAGLRPRPIQPRGHVRHRPGVPKDDAKAVKWYRLAAEQGYARAQYNLGVMYATGRGVLKDRILAHIWFNIAGANGHAQAHEIRDTVERELTRAEVTRATELARACMDSDYQSCEP